jgi:alkylation response protein AidB-like acyl-CoA dehydrogenase
MPGFERGRNLDKIGMHAQDTSELSFTDVAVPAANLLGEEGGGFVALMQNLPRERIAIGATALAGADRCSPTRSRTASSGRRSGGRSAASSTAGSSSPRWPPSSPWRGRSPTGR